MADASTRVVAPPARDRKHSPIWVLDDPSGPGNEAPIAIAERLGVPFRRVPLTWTWQGRLAGLVGAGSLLGLAAPERAIAGAAPALTVSSGPRAGAVAAWIRQWGGSAMIHFGAHGLLCRAADLGISDQGWSAGGLTVLGVPHRLSPLVLRQAKLAWQSRLDHLPHPRLALLVGSGRFGAELAPSQTHRLGLRIAAACRAANGAVLVVTSPRTGVDATEALAAGLADCLHLLYRSGDPGPDAYPGFLASADAVVVAGAAERFLSEACTAEAPVYVADLGVATGRSRRLQAALIAARQIRPLRREIKPWTRPVLDEAGRAAREILARFAIE